MRFIKFLIVTYLLMIISCSPSLGASWYAKSGRSGGVSMYVTSIKVMDKDVTVNDPDYRATEGDAILNFARAKRFSITVPHSVKVIDADSFSVEVYEDSKKQKPLSFGLEIEGDSVPLVQGESVSVILRVKDNRGRYAMEEKFISVTREQSEDPETPNEPDPNVPSEPEPPALENPVDENGQKKFKVKINVKKEKVDPFEYYDKDYAFPASRFDGWILNMTSMTNDNVASYAFKEGEWSGTPLSCTGDDVGQGQMNVTRNLRYYKYKDQEERWQERGGYSSTIDETEKKKRERFIFFRFTGSASMGIRLDNSMFCLDTHTKFLFYYSDPASISGVGVPSDWRDYDEPDKGKHKHFDKPFYLTDPVGYVKEDGECVIYGWCKQHIIANNYTATEDPSYRRQASRSSGGKGYSPYRDEKIKTIKERIVEENPDYTAEKPVITGQSGSLYLALDSSEEAKLSVTVKPAPENEELSFQWYKNSIASKDGGVAIDGAVLAEYTMPKEVIDVYCYCVVTNKNKKNNREAKTISQPVKVRISQSSADLKIDAEIPIIKKHPQSSKYAFVEGNKTEISLSIEVNKPKDNGVLSYQWFESSNEEAVENGTKIENATEKNYKTELSDSGIKYYYCRVTNTNDKATGEKSVSVVSAVAKIEIEQLYKLTVSCLGKGSLEVIGANDGNVVLDENNPTTQLSVKLGTKLFLLATPEKGWEIEKWEGDIETLGDVRNARIVLKNKVVVEKGVTLTFRNIPKRGLLGISSILIENVSLTGKMWGKSYNFTYFDWDIKVGLKDDREESYESIWKNKKIRFMQQTAGASSYVMPTENAKDLEVLLENAKATFNLNTYLHKKDSSELGGIYVNEFDICKHDKNVIEFDYHEDTDSWHVKDGEFNQIETVTLDFDKTFTLKRGQEKNFAITYKVNNPSYHATGNVRIVYTLRWE